MNCVYPWPLTYQKDFFAVLYVSVMGLTCCYKTTVFLHLLEKITTKLASQSFRAFVTPA